MFSARYRLGLFKGKFSVLKGLNDCFYNKTDSVFCAVQTGSF